VKPLVDEVPRVGVALLRGGAVAPYDREVRLHLAINGEGAARTVTVKLAWSPMPHGGARPAWVCPGCGTARRWLHWAQDRLVCRRDLGLTYRCQRDRKTAHYEQVVRPLMAAARRGEPS
jgi:hypothetical protein